MGTQEEEEEEEKEEEQEEEEKERFNSSNVPPSKSPGRRIKTMTPNSYLTI